MMGALLAFLAVAAAIMPRLTNGDAPRGSLSLDGGGFVKLKRPRGEYDWTCWLMRWVHGFGCL